MARFSSEALAVLEQHGYRRGETQANRARIARDLGRLHLANIVEGDSEEEADEKGTTNAEDRFALMGTVEDAEAQAQLDSFIAECNRPEGPVQDYVNRMMNGSTPPEEEEQEESEQPCYYLLAKRAKRVLTNEEGEPVKTIPVHHPLRQRQPDPGRPLRRAAGDHEHGARRAAYPPPPRPDGGGRARARRAQAGLARRHQPARPARAAVR